MGRASGTPMGSSRESVASMAPGAVAVFSGGGTGGHLYPALALAEALRALRPDVRPFFLGARRGLEARVLPERGLPHHLLPVRPFRRGVLWENLGVLRDLVRSLFSAGELFSRLRPGVVVVTGGYAGGPAGIVAGLMGIPLALQEQNAYPGATTRLLSRWSREVHLAFPEARDRLPPRARRKARVTGNPIRRPGDEDAGSARARLGLGPQGIVVLVTGGSQGSAALNGALLQAVAGVEKGEARRPEALQLLWITGPRNLDEVKAALAAMGSPSWVKAVGYCDDMPDALAAADLAVSRAGAMTTSEFLAWGVPAVLVPLPTAAADHQRHNAESLHASGAALHLPEAELTGARLWTQLLSLVEDDARLDAMRQAALGRGEPEATDIIAAALAALLPGRREVAS